MQDKNRRWWGWLTPEIIILVIIPTAIVIVISLLGLLDHHALAPAFWKSFLYVRFFGWQMFHVIFYIGLAYFVFGAVARLVYRIRSRHDTSAESSPAARRSVERFRASKNFLWIALMYLYAIIVNLVALNAVGFPNPQRVAWADELLMRRPYPLWHLRAIRAALPRPVQLAGDADHLLVPLAHLRALNGTDRIVHLSGGPFSPIHPWFHTNHVSRLADVGGVSGGYAQRSLPHHQGEIASALRHRAGNRWADHPPRPQNDEFLDRLEVLQSDPKAGRYLVSTLPSPHVAWGILVVWFGVGLYSRSVLVLLPWGVLNCVGAIYSLQHYAVDAVAGIIVAFIAIFLVRGLVALEARLGLAAPEGYGLNKSIQKDIVAVGQAVWPSVRRKLVRAKTRNRSGDCRKTPPAK